jgi:hypothetical protein
LPNKTFATQVAKDVSASHKKLVELFALIRFFFQRLDYCTKIPLPQEAIEFLGEIMAQVLSVLALSIKTMKEGRISVWIRSMCLSFLD